MVTAACQAVGVGRRTVYDRRSRDPEFRETWDDAIAAAFERLEREAYVRAVNGSDRLLMFLLRRRRPEVYSERDRVQRSRHINTPRPVLDHFRP